MRLPRKLTEEDGGPFGNEAPGDLAYYAPWGNLAKSVTFRNRATRKPPEWLRN
jgi:hypothetical protein